jgi:hypothetical protein
MTLKGGGTIGDAKVRTIFIGRISRGLSEDLVALVSARSKLRSVSEWPGSRPNAPDSDNGFSLRDDDLNTVGAKVFSRSFQRLAKQDLGARLGEETASFFDTIVLTCLAGIKRQIREAGKRVC